MVLRMLMNVADIETYYDGDLSIVYHTQYIMCITV